MEAQYKVLCVCLEILPFSTAEVVFRHYCDQHQLNIIVDSAGTSNYHPNKALISVANCMQKKEAMTYLLCGQDNFQLKTF
ncbi:Putative phosphotyrosine protein phosphatase [Acinetobacter baumannii]|nr:Putative phosphotyrosine protein phosphatase [Acinetobacter baumannii]